MLQALTTFFAAGGRRVVQGDLVRESDPVVKGRESLFVNIEDLVPEIDKPKGRRSRKPADAAE